MVAETKVLMARTLTIIKNEAIQIAPRVQVSNTFHHYMH